MSDFNNLAINKVINVIKYTLIQYREENNDLIRTVRQVSGENLMFNDVAPTKVAYDDYAIYTVLEEWVTLTGQALPQNVPDTFTTYYAKRLTVQMPNEINIIRRNNVVIDYTTTDLITIVSNENVYCKNEVLADYIIRYTLVRSNQNGKVRTVVYTYINSKLTELIETITLNLTLKIYRDEECRELIDEIPMVVNIDSSSVPTGD